MNIFYNFILQPLSEILAKDGIFDWQFKGSWNIYHAVEAYQTKFKGVVSCFDILAVLPDHY